ncbi:MAG: hypothetical protein ACREAX_02395, partial [Candidatus Nitrosotenuis sp.]
MEVRQAAEKLIKVSPSVRVVTICDMNGRVLFTQRSRRVKMLLSKQESKMSLQTAARAWKVRKKLENKLGACKYALAEYS